MSDCCSAPGLLPFDVALEKMLANITGITEQAPRAIEDSQHLILAEDIHSPMNVPPHNNSAMDGYAFSAASLAQLKTLTLVGKAMAGQPYSGKLNTGECIRIMTGAKLPSCCDAVEMQENCKVDGEKITFEKDRSVGDNVRNAGEDIKRGQAVFSQGHKITAVDIGVLASLGVKTVNVYRQLTVALIATGDELKLPGQALLEGDIFESNSFVLAGMLNKLNVKVINFGIIADDYQLIKTAFEQANQQADVVISSGGVSVGDADYTKDVLDELGEIGFWKIAMKPGKPFAFGNLSDSIFFGLPGNPVSALVTFYQLAIKGINKLQNAAVDQRIKVSVKTATNLNKSPGRMDFQRGFLSVNSQGETMVSSTGAQGSGILSSLANANCFIILPAEQGNVAAGDLVTVELFDEYLR